jgi:hypothetical protein
MPIEDTRYIERLLAEIEALNIRIADYDEGTSLMSQEIERLRAAMREMPEVSLEFTKKEDWIAWTVWKKKHAEVLLQTIRGTDND